MLRNKRFLLPLLLAILLVLSFLFPPLFGVVNLITAPIWLSMHWLGLALDWPRDLFIPSMTLSFVAFFLVGLAWDKAAEWHRNRRSSLH